MHIACVHTAIDLHAMQKMSVSVKRSKNTDALVDRQTTRVSECEEIKAALYETFDRAKCML